MCIVPLRDKNGPSILAWNAKLREAAEAFANAHADASVGVWSSWALFDRMFADPHAFGFTTDDVERERGAIFADGLHPTTAVHNIIADELLAFLEDMSRRKGQST